MTKSARQTKPRPREDRGGRFSMVLELEPDDQQKLLELVKRYSKALGPDVKSTKAFVLRKLIRFAASSRVLPQDPV